MNKKTVPIFLAFLCMGFGDVVGPLVGLAKDTFSLTNFVAQLLTFSGFIMFGILSIPMGLYQDKKGKKHVLFVGLLVALIGLLLAIISGMYGAKNLDPTATTFYFLLISILLLGAGATTLQVSGNPIMRDVSEEGAYSSNLSLGQSIKAIGSSMGFLLPPFVAKMFGLDWSILFPIYAFLILITIIILKLTPIHERQDEQSERASFVSCMKLLGNPYVFFMVFAIFLYVGAEVSMSSGVPILLKESFGIKGLQLLVSWSLFFLPIFLGRFVGSVILRFLSPRIFLVITVLVSITGIIALFLGNQAIAFAGIFLVGLGFANIFPLIFSITVDAMPARSNELSGLMVTAIVGGAFVPPIMGFTADTLKSPLAGFIVPTACILYIAVVAFMNLKKGDQ